MTCTQPTHGEGDCLAKNLECFNCGEIGHVRHSKTRKKKKKAEEKKVPKSRRVEEPDVDSDSKVEYSCRVKEVVRGMTLKSKIPRKKRFDAKRKTVEIEIRVGGRPSGTTKG